MSLTWLQTARHGGQVERCHTVPTIQSYNVGEHTFNAIIIARVIRTNLPERVACRGKTGQDKISGHNIVYYLLTHDLAEGFTGDMPANVKREGGIKATMDALEKAWEEKHLPKYMQVDLNEAEYFVAKLADILELCMFCKDELMLGNRHPLFLPMAIRVSEYAEEWCNFHEVYPEIVEDVIKDLRGAIPK